MDRTIHGYVLTLAPIPALATTLFKYHELAWLLLVKAEVEVLRDHREANRNSMHAKFDKQYETYQLPQRAQSYGRVSLKVQRALDDVVTTRYATDQLFRESTIMVSTINRVIANCRLHISDQETPQLLGYTLTLAVVYVLISSSYLQDESACLLVLRDEVGMLWTLKMIHQDKTRKDYDEHEDTLSFSRGSQASDKIMHDIHKLMDEAD